MGSLSWHVIGFNLNQILTGHYHTFCFTIAPAHCEDRADCRYRVCDWFGVHVSLSVACSTSSSPKTWIIRVKSPFRHQLDLATLNEQQYPVVSFQRVALCPNINLPCRRISMEPPLPPTQPNAIFPWLQKNIQFNVCIPLH